MTQYTPYFEIPWPEKINKIADAASLETVRDDIRKVAQKSDSAMQGIKSVADRSLSNRRTLVGMDVRTLVANSDMGIHTLWAPDNSGLPKDARGRCTLTVTKDPANAIVLTLTERESQRTWQMTRQGDGTWLDWLDLGKHGTLTEFASKLLNAGNKQLNAVVVGDSNGEGVGSIIPTDRWVNRLQGALSRSLGLSQGATYPFIPPKYGYPSDDHPVTLTGNTVQGGYNWGYGWRAASLRDDTTVCTFTFEGTSAAVMYLEGPACGIMTVSIDGATPVVVNTNAATTKGSRRLETGPLSKGTHTVTVRRSPTTATSGQYVFLEGLLTWNEDESSGVRVIDASMTGRAMSAVTSERANFLGQAIAQTGSVGLVIVNLATNDARNGTTLTDYRARTNQLIDWLRSWLYLGPILLTLPHKSADHTDAQLMPYGEILADIAKTRQGVDFFDLGLMLPDAQDDVNAMSTQGLYFDRIHYSHAGHKEVAGHFMDRIAG